MYTSSDFLDVLEMGMVELRKVFYNIGIIFERMIR